MFAPPYVDIHTHLLAKESEDIVIRSLSLEEIQSGDFKSIRAIAGIHPWWFEDYTIGELQGLKARILSLLDQKRLWGIGETGLDRTMPEFFDHQKDFFLWHMELSENYHLPLVLHNVRSGSDFLSILKSHKVQSPWIFHDFRGNEQLIKDLLRLHPNCFFSFGISLDNSPQVREVLSLVPIENLLLETDAQKHLSIQDIYVRASAILGVDLEFLRSQLFHNLKKIA